MLFSCSVRDNIAYGSPDPLTVTDTEVIEAARKANAYNFINSFPDKFNTLVGERGQTLSGNLCMTNQPIDYWWSSLQD